MTAWNKVMTADRFGLAKGFVRNRVSRGAFTIRAGRETRCGQASSKFGKPSPPRLKAKTATMGNFSV